MHYITQLQNENKNLKQQVALCEEGLRNIMIYLGSSKFENDPMVHSRDIQLRIREIMFNLFNAQE